MVETTPVNFEVALVLDTGEEAKVFVPQPNDVELTRISRVLSYIFREMDKNPLQILLIDWERMIDEALSGLSKELADNVKKQTMTFLDRCVSSGICDLKDINTLSDSETSLLKGSLLFISALYRYVYQRAKIESSGIKGFFTSLSATDWKKSLSKRSEESQAESTIAPADVSVTLS